MPNSAGEVHLGDQYTCYSVYQDYVRDLEEQNALGNDMLRILCRTGCTLSQTLGCTLSFCES